MLEGQMEHFHVVTKDLVDAVMEHFHVVAKDLVDAVAIRREIKR